MEDILFTKEEGELIELLKYFRNMVLINNETPPYNRLILQEEIDYFDGEINIITRFAKAKTEFGKLIELENYKKWNTKLHLSCPWCKTRIFVNALGEIKMDDGFTYAQYYCESCKMNFESEEPNNLHDYILYMDKYLAYLSKPDKNGRTQQQIKGISFEYMKKERKYIVELKEKEKKKIKETKETEDTNNEFMKYVLNELIRLNLAKGKFIIENDIH